MELAPGRRVKPAPRVLVRPVAALGQSTVQLVASYGRFGTFLADTARAVPDVTTWGPLLMVHMRRLGVDSLPIALFLAAFTGAAAFLAAGRLVAFFAAFLAGFFAAFLVALVNSSSVGFWTPSHKGTATEGFPWRTAAALGAAAELSFVLSDRFAGEAIPASTAKVSLAAVVGEVRVVGRFVMTLFRNSSALGES